MPSVAAIATIVTGIYSAKKQSDTANNAAKLQTDSANRSADIAKQSSDAALAYQNKQSDITNAQHESAQKGNYDQWAAHERALNQLSSQFGLPQVDIPAYVPSNFGSAAGGAPPTPGATGPTNFGGAAGAPASGGGASAFIKGLLDKGMDPQQAVQMTNQQLGLKTGSEAVYYDPSQHGGVATIGLPDAYLALTNGQWNVTQRQGGGASAAGQQPQQTLGASILQARPNAQPMASTEPLAPPPMNFGRALGAY